MASPKDRFSVKSQVVIEDKTKRKAFCHVDVCTIENRAFIKCAGESKRRLQHLLGDVDLDGVLAELIRKRDEIIDGMIATMIATNDPMQEQSHIDIESLSSKARQEKFLLAKVPAILCIKLDCIESTSCEDHAVSVLSTHTPKSAISFEAIPANFDWLAQAAEVDWTSRDSTDLLMEMVYKHIDVDWDRVKLWHGHNRLIFRTIARANGARKEYRLTVPNKLVERFKQNDQSAADEIAMIASRVADACADEPADEPAEEIATAMEEDEPKDEDDHLETSSTSPAKP